MAVKIASAIKADEGWFAQHDDLNPLLPIIAWAVTEFHEHASSEVEAIVVDPIHGRVLLLGELILSRKLPSDGWTFTR